MFKSYLIIVVTSLVLASLIASKDATANSLKEQTPKCLQAAPHCGSGRYAQCVCTGHTSKDCIWVCWQ